jgi:hypothetical protein
MEGLAHAALVTSCKKGRDEGETKISLFRSFGDRHAGAVLRRNIRYCTIVVI